MPHSSPHPAHRPIASGSDTPEFAATATTTATCPSDAQAVDEKIRQAGSHAAKLIWLVALASDAVIFDLLQELWHADLQASAELQEMKAMLDKLANLPPDLAQRREAIVQGLPPVVLAQLEKLKANPPGTAPALSVLLADLLSAGLLIETRKEHPLESPTPDSASAPMLAYACPQLVRVRSLALAGADFDAKPIWLAYGKHENRVCHALKNTDMTAAIAAASRAFTYYMQAGDYGAVASFLAALDTDQAADQRLAESLLPQMHPTPKDTPDTTAARIASANAAKHAAFAQHDWAGALPHIELMLQLKPTLQPPPEATDMGVDHFNRAMALMQLARLDEACRELEICLDIFQAEPDMMGKVHGQLANVLALQGKLEQAISQQRKGLALIEAAPSDPPGSLPDPRDRVISHNNLAGFLTRTNMARDYIEASCHQIAVIAYSLCVPKKEQALRRKWAVGVLKARIDSNNPLIPPLAEVLAQEAFAPLAKWLQQWQKENHSTMAKLQAQIDEIAAQVLKAK